MSVKDLRALGEVLDVVKERCRELNELHDDDHTSAAKGWIEDIAKLTNFGGRAKNARLRDEVLIVASHTLREK